jgi:hypothetical protein
MKPIESPISGTMFFGRMVGRRLSGFSRLWCGDEKREIRSEKREFRNKRQEPRPLRFSKPQRSLWKKETKTKNQKEPNLRNNFPILQSV